jgi:hypothetical protein
MSAPGVGFASLALRGENNMRQRRLSAWVSVGLLSAWALSACGGGASGTEDVPAFDGDCKKITPPSYSEVASSFFTYCVGCHSAAKAGNDRNGAPSGLDFDTYDHAIVGALPGVAMVKQRKMPYPDGVGPTDAERNLFYEWALCGTPK